MFINESKILKKIYLGDKFSIVIHLVYYLNILPQLMYNSTQFKEGGYRRQLTIAWLFWDVTFYYEVKQNNSTTETVVDGSLVNNYLKETINTVVEPEKAPLDEDVNKEIAKRRFDDLEFTKIKLKMIQARDLFKRKWDEIEDSIKKNNYYTVTPEDLADANFIINKPKSVGKESEYSDYFRKHFNQMTITSEDVSIWSKLEKEWLEEGNFITPIPMDGSKITGTDLIHTLMFAPPEDIFDYLRSRMFGQKDKQSWELSDDNIDTAIISALNQVGISEANTKRFDIVKKSWEKFNEKYGGELGSLFEFSYTESANKIKKFFIDNYSDNWDKVRESITKNYYFNCYDFSKGGRADIGVVSNTSVFKKILKDIFDIDSDLPENEYVKEYLQKYTYNIKFTLNDLDRPALNDWSSELFNLIGSAESDPRGSCECVLANKLVKYAYAPSRNWGIHDFYIDIEEARRKFDMKLLDTLYSKKWKEVYDSIQTTGKYEVTVEDLKQYTKDYYTYVSNKVKELSNTYVFTPSLEEILERIDTAFAIDTNEYQKFEITREKYTSWKEDKFFTCCGGVVPVYPTEWTEWEHRDEMFSYAYLLDDDKSIKEDILAHSYIFVPPACMTDFYEKNKNQSSTEEKAKEAVRIIQEAAEEAIKSIRV
jgi:hypothetical protein